MPYYRKNLYVLSVTSFLAATSWTLILPFLPLFLTELGVEEQVSQWAGVVFGIHFFAAIVMAPVWGNIADRVGAKPMTVRAGLSIGIIYILTAMASQVWHLVVLRFFNGAFSGMIPMSLALVGSNTPREYARRYVALLQTAVALGQIVGPTIGGILASLFGYRRAFYVAGSAMLLSAFLIIALVEERQKPQKSRERTSMLSDLRTALKSPVLLACIFLSLMGSIGTVGVQPILALHMEALLTDPDPWVTGLVFSLPGVALAATATWWVRQLEVRGHRRISATSLLGTAVFATLAGLAGNVLVFAVLFLFMALFNAALRPVSAALISTEVESSFQGRAFGIQQSAHTFGGVIGPLVTGAVAGLWGSGAAFVGIGLLFFIGFGVLRLHFHRADPTRAKAETVVPGR